MAKGGVALFENIQNEDVQKIFGTAPLYTFDVKNLYRQGFNLLDNSFDVMLSAYLINPSASDYSLSRLVSEYGVVLPEIKDCPETYTTTASLVGALPTLCEKLSSKMNADGQTELFNTIEMPLARVLASMETEGFLVDAAGLKSFGEKLGKDIDRIEKEIYDLVGYEFNLNSPKQLSEALFVKLGLTPVKKTKSGFSTNAEVLVKLKNEHPAVALLLEYRTLAKLKSTYADGLLNVIGGDGRIHSTLNQTETRTGRISSSEPNLQNIPVRREIGKELRRFFIAKEGCVLVDADYSQIELRVLAHMANDENMISAFLSGEDIHTATAAKVFNMHPQLVTPLMRSRAKAVNFGIVYGIGAYSLANDLGISFGEAKKYIDGYLKTYSGVAQFMEKLKEEINHAQMTYYSFDSYVEARIQTIAKEKFCSWEWIFAKSPKCDMIKRGRVDGGTLEICVSLENGRIKQCQILGDYFFQKDIVQLENALIGCIFEEKSLQMRLKEVEAATFFYRVNNENILKILMN